MQLRHLPPALVHRIGTAVPAQPGLMTSLLATMTPMGSALKSLSDGNLAQVSENLTVAFSAVILALIAALITLWAVNVRRRWLAEELLEIAALLITVAKNPLMNPFSHHQDVTVFTTPSMEGMVKTGEKYKASGAIGEGQGPRPAPPTGCRTARSCMCPRPAPTPRPRPRARPTVPTESGCSGYGTHRTRIPQTHLPPLRNPAPVADLHGGIVKRRASP